MSSFKTGASEFASTINLAPTRDELAIKADRLLWSGKVEWTIRKSYVDDGEWKSFLKVWSQYQASEISAEELEARIERFNRVGRFKKRSFDVEDVSKSVS